jgi:nucleotide-binding universal stress UspA family protein
MARRANDASSSSAPLAPTHSGPLRSVLVPIDLTPASDRVLGRVARLPVAEDARIRLLHVVPEGLVHRDRIKAQRDAKKALTEEARHLAASLPGRAIVEAVVEVGAAAKVITDHATALAVDLVVMGRGGGRAVHDAFLGSTAERVIRRGQVPVLVVRLRARGPYRRPALAVDLDDALRSVLPLALRVLPPPRPRLTVIHAYSTAYHGLVYPSLSDDQGMRRELRPKIAQQLSKALLAAVAAAQLPPGDVPLWKLDIRYGSPRLVIEKAVAKAEADLLVLGTSGRAGIAHALLGTVAGDVLREVGCDVLVVPPPPAREGGG